ncbi:MAG: hypothetical protein WC728_02115 [Elusimicrobiota bacterium]
MSYKKLRFRTEEERQVYAMKLAMERVEKLEPSVIEKCGRERLLHDFQQEILLELPLVSRARDRL